MKYSVKRIVLNACAFLLAFTAGFALASVYEVRKIDKRDVNVAIDVDAADPTDRVTRIAVLGRDRAAGLTDSIFIVTVNETAHRASVLQIPRDTYAQYTDGDYRKLNGALGVLGEGQIKRFFSEALGVRIHYFLILDLSALDTVVDAIGGVDIVSPCEMHYSDPEQGLEINLPRGPVHLDGRMAEQFVRYRSGYVNADLGRLDAQKLFLRAFAQRCVTLSPGSVMRVLSVTLTKLQTDVDLPSAFRIVSALRQCDPEQTPMETLAGQAVRGTSGAWYYVVNRAGAERMREEYLMPSARDLDTFDPDRIFDRPKTPSFHNVYIAPEADLPTDDA